MLGSQREAGVLASTWSCVYSSHLNLCLKGSALVYISAIKLKYQTV